MNAPSDMNGKSNAPDVFETVENLRIKAKSQIKTANMIGKFVTPILRRKITSFVTEQLALLTQPAEPSRAARPNAPTPPKAVTEVPAPRASSPARKRPTGTSTTTATRPGNTTALRGTSSAPAAGKSPGIPAAKTKVKPVAKAAATSKATPTSKAKPTATSKAKPTAAPTARPAAKATSVGKPTAKRQTPATVARAGANRAPQRTSNSSSRAVSPEPGVRETPENPLGIDGYDGLPSSSIVPLLDGLSQPQLRAVEAYEQANRARRTVLHRAKQLQSS